MSFELYEKKHKNNSYGISFSKGAIYFYRDFTVKYIPSDITGVALYTDENTKEVAFSFYNNATEAYKLHRTPAGTAYVICKSFTKIMEEYGYQERRIMIPKNKDNLWIISK